MKGLISLKAFANEIKDLKFIDEVNEIDYDLLNIKIGGEFYTDGFVERMTEELNKVWVMCMGMISNFVALDIEHLVDDWFSIGVKAK